MITLDIFGSEPNKKLNEALGLYGPFTATINTGERPQSRTKTKKFRREDDAILWAEDWLENAPQYVFATAQVTDPDGNVVWTTDESVEEGVAEGRDIENYHHTGPAADKKAQAHAKKLGPDWAAYRHPSADKWDNLHIVVKKHQAPKDLQGVTEGPETHKYHVVVVGHKRSYDVWVDAKNEDVAIIRAQQYVTREHNDTTKRASVVDMKKGMAEGVEIIDQDYDMDQQIFKINVDGKTLQFTYWDYDENWANPDIKEIYAQVQDRLTGLSPQQQKAVAKAVYRAVKQDAIKEDAAGVQSNIDTSSPNFNHLLYMLRNDYPVPRGRLINKVMMNGQWLDPDEIKELVKSNQLWKGLGYGQEGYNVRGQGPGEKVYEQGMARQPVNEISPHDYDSDEDYYAALRGRRRPSYNDDSDFDPELDRPQDDGDDESYYEKYVRTKGLEEEIPYWSSGTGAYSTQAAKGTKSTKPVSTPGTKATKVVSGGPTPEERAAFEKRIAAAKKSYGVKEENKKKVKDDGLGKIQDVGLERSISKSLAANPTAQTGIQALMKDFMKDQENDQKEFEKVRSADRRQDKLLAQISQIDKDQEKELQDLDKENDTLAQRLQQLQQVNNKLEKQLAAMSGRKPKEKTAARQKAEPKAPDVAIPTPKTGPTSKSVATTKNLPAPKQTEPDDELDPGTQAFAQMTPQLGQQQKDLFGTDYSGDTVQMAKNKAIQNVKNIKDVPYVDFRMLGNKDLEKVAQQTGIKENNKEQEADYGDKYQDMVARVGQKAREQEKKKPVDIKDLARRLAAVKLKDEK